MIPLESAAACCSILFPMMRLSTVSTLLLVVSSVSGFTVPVPRGATPVRPQPPLSSRNYDRQQNNKAPPRSRAMQLQMGIDISEIAPVSVFLASVIAVSVMQSNSTNSAFTPPVLEVVQVDEVDTVDTTDVIAAEEDAIMAAQTEAILEEIDAVEQAEIKEAEKEEPAPKPVVAAKPPPPPAPKPAPPPPAPKPAPVVAKTEPASAPKPASDTTTATADDTTSPEKTTPDTTLPKPVSTPRFQVFRKKAQSETEKSISDLKRQVSSTIEGEKEKGDRLKQAAEKREKEEKVATTAVKKDPAPVATKASATATSVATPAATATAKDIKLKKSTTTTTASSDTPETSDDDDSSFESKILTVDTSSSPPTTSRRRKVWRVVKKVVAPWRKWENIS